jgi:hypothetical protein
MSQWRWSCKMEDDLNEDEEEGYEEEKAIKRCWANEDEALKWRMNLMKLKKKKI